MPKVVLFFTCLLIVMLAYAQPGTWNIVNAKVEINNQWSVFGEVQLRSLKFYNNFHYYEFKGGTTFTLNKNFSLQAGLGNYDTYAEGGNFKTPMVNDEFRSWLQFAMKNNVNRVRFEHRYRAEQRWTINGYRNRFRYRFQTIIPVNNQKLEKGTLYAAAWNELFFTNRAPYFERNRIFAGLGYELSDKLAIQAGFLNQFDYRLNDETGRNFLQLSFLYQFTLKMKKQEYVPGGTD
jgi:hypothetical protein